MNATATCYWNGKGVVKDLHKALEWYKRAAAAGNPLSMNSVGTFYTRGLGVPKDAKIAAEWFQKAADGGLAAAMS
jgi:uncharacterized protein